jgi:GNAT superfamily N-acetyltransferase
VFYDVTTFLYYLLVAHDPVPAIANTDLADPPNPTPSAPSHIFDELEAAAAGGGDPTAQVGEGEERGSGGQVVGFFSKEKMSWDNNNLACILVFPPWQKQGLGQILMGASYEMSKRERRLGGPEKRKSCPVLSPHFASKFERCRENKTGAD